MEPFRQGSSLPGLQVSPPPPAPLVKRFDQPEQILILERGRLELISLGGLLVGRGSYAPGFRWSRCVAAGSPPPRHEAPAHVGMVLSGRSRMALREGGGPEVDLLAGDFFHIAADFDVWVAGYRPCEVLYLSGVNALLRELHRV